MIGVVVSGSIDVGMIVSVVGMSVVEQVGRRAIGAGRCLTLP